MTAGRDPSQTEHRGRPADHRQELGQDHRRRPPNALLADLEVGHVIGSPLPLTRQPPLPRRLGQCIDRNLEPLLDLELVPGASEPKVMALPFTQPMGLKVRVRGHRTP